MIENLTDGQTFALTLWGECRGESVEGQIAVGQVIFNRSRLRKKTIKEICLQPKQFSCWNESDINYVTLQKMIENFPKDNTMIKQFLWIYSGLRNKCLSNPINALCENYLTKNLYYSKKVDWANKMKIVRTIGSHVFLL